MKILGSSFRRDDTGAVKSGQRFRGDDLGMVADHLRSDDYEVTIKG